MERLPALIVILAFAAAATPAVAPAATPLPAPAGIELFDVRPPPSEGGGIAAGPEGDLWFTEKGEPAVGKITPAGESTEYSLGLNGARPGKISTGPDGNLWFEAQAEAGKIGRLSPAGELTGLFAPELDSGDIDLTAGPDGAVWFTELAGDAIGRLAPDGQLTRFPLPSADAEPSAIATAPDGSLWFAETGAGAVGRITAAGRISEFPLPPAKEGPRGIAVTPQGSVWVSEFGRRRIAEIGPGGGFLEVRLPENSIGPQDIVSDDQGDLWFVLDLNSIWQMAPTGATTRFALKTQHAGDCRREVCEVDPIDLARGAEGRIWFVTGSAGSGTIVGNIDPMAPPRVPVPVGRPALRGVAAAGERLVARPGPWTNGPVEFSYHWRRCNRLGYGCEEIKGARKASFVPGEDEIGHRLTVGITASNAAGSSFRGTAPTPLIGAPPRSLRVRVESTRLRVRGRGSTIVRLSCGGGPTGGECGGKLRILGAGSNAGRLGEASYRLRRGSVSRIGVGLAAGALAALEDARGHSLRVLVGVTLWGERRAGSLATLHG